MHRLVKSIFLISLLLFFPSTFVFAEEITITTYYPSPYGSYNELGTNKFAVDIAGVAVATEFAAMQIGDAHIGRSLIIGREDGFDYDAGATTANGTLLVKGPVGIGTTSPGYALDVIGQIRMSGSSGTKQVVADVAEVIPVADDVEEGDVVCIDNTVKTYQLAKSKTPDSLLVAGVISSTKNNSKSIPALLIGDYEQKQKDNPNQKYRYLAIAGQIAVKVCLEGGTINKGDLLTSSSVSGYAMKSQRKQLGTIIGKALEDFDGKEGEKGTIIALLNLM